MFEPNAFFPNNVASPVRNQQSKTIQSFSPAYPSSSQIDWNAVPHTPPPHRDLQKNEEVPYGVRVRVDNDRETSSTSSDSEETDTVHEVDTFSKTSVVNGWDFGQNSAERRKSEPFISGNPLIQKVQPPNAQQNPRGWTPYLPPKVNVRQCYFGPLNLLNYVQNDKKAYFVILEGYHIGNSRKLFKLERLCQSLQAINPSDDKDGRPFLYINLWNEAQHGHSEPENVFEPWIYAIPQTQFKIVVTVNMSHSYEDAYSFDFMVDLRQHALPSKERRTQNLEVNYSDLGSSNSSFILGTLGNNITLHTQITNEKLPIPHGFKNVQELRGNGKQDILFDYTTILRQVIISLPLSRTEKAPQPVFPFATPHMHKPHDVYAKRGSAIMLGQHQGPRFMEEGPHSPVSWSNFSPEGSPLKSFASSNQNIQQAEPAMPPGIGCGVGNNEPSNFMPGGSLFKFKSQGQQRLSIQAIGESRNQQEKLMKRPCRYSTDFSVFLEGDKSPLKVLEAHHANALNNKRRASQTSEASTPKQLGNVFSRFQSPSGPGFSDNNTPAKSISTTNISSRTNSMAELAYPEEEESIVKSTNSLNSVNAEDFRVEEYIGRMVEFAQTYQGSKVLQKYITTSDKEKLEPIVQELSEKIGDLLLDPYANYMIQTLVQYGSPSQRLHILQNIGPCFNNIARDKKGTHSLQAIVAQIDSVNEFNMMKTIIGSSVFELSMDSRANYVIQKLINTIPVESSNFLYQPLFNNFVQVANNSFGLLVLKQVMGRVEHSGALKQKVIELTCSNFEKLVQDQYGNYAIQHIIEFYPKESLVIMNKVLAKIIPYSSQKISSNVIEKCLMMCDDQFRKRIVDEILKSGRFGDLLKNKYGNFVTLQLLAASANPEQSKLMQEISKCANLFNGTKYKNRWLTFVEQNPLNIKWIGNIGPNQEDETVVDQEKESLKAQDENRSEADQAKLRKIVNEKRLEEVKKIWRDMTKDEKSEVTPFHPGKGSNRKKHYN